MNPRSLLGSPDLVARQAQALGFYPPLSVQCPEHLVTAQPESYILQCPDECVCPTGPHTFGYADTFSVYGAEPKRCTRCGFPVYVCDNSAGFKAGCLPEYRPER